MLRQNGCRFGWIAADEPEDSITASGGTSDAWRHGPIYRAVLATSKA